MLRDGGEKNHRHYSGLAQVRKGATDHDQIRYLRPIFARIITLSLFMLVSPERKYSDVRKKAAYLPQTVANVVGNPLPLGFLSL